jgi:hypothetical protein
MVLLATALLVAPVAAHVAMRWWVANPVTTSYTTVGDTTACLSTGAVGHQELGVSGITRLRAKFELRLAYDPGTLPYVPASTGWLYSNSFADDARNYWNAWSFGFRYARDRDYWIRAVLLGERPSFWEPDLKLKLDLGGVVCYTEVDLGG